jgi:plastocyanin
MEAAMIAFRIVLGIVLVTTLAGCGGSSTPAPTSPSQPSSPAVTTVTIPNGARTLGAGAFVPNPVTVSLGTTVTWSNTDAASSHDVVADSGAFNSGLFGNGANFSFTFQSRGTFTYHCSIHPGMVGTVVVQ